jgi:hypothetical protein
MRFNSSNEVSPLGTSATTGLLYQPRMMDIDECGAVGATSGKGNRSTRRIPVPVPLCLPQIRYDLIRDRTRAAAMGSQRLPELQQGQKIFPNKQTNC